MARKTVLEMVDEVQDPSDFKAQPDLMQLDSALRCNICRELYDGPVSINCGHCFCSLCLRNSMNTKAECPDCRKSANEGHIRPNIALEEAVASWRASRGMVLQLVTDSLRQSGQKRRMSEESDDDVQLVAGPSKRLKKDLSFVQCPACGRDVKVKSINSHLDSGCKPSTPPPDVPDKAKQKDQWSKLMGGGEKKSKEKGKADEEERLPKVSYHVMKEKQLRELLSRYNLNTSGDKNALITRHQQWSVFYNANLDKSVKHRQTVEQLRTKLKKWEELGKGKKVVVDDVEEYEKTHKDEFDKLLQQARPKKPLSQAQTPKTEDVRDSPSFLAPDETVEVD